MEVLENDIDNALSLFFWGVMFEVAEVPTIWFYVFFSKEPTEKKQKSNCFNFRAEKLFKPPMGGSTCGSQLKRGHIAFGPVGFNVFFVSQNSWELHLLQAILLALLPSMNVIPIEWSTAHELLVN